MIENMTLKVDLRQFLDEKGNLLLLTEQASTVFKFLSEIVLSVSQESGVHTIEQPFNSVNLRCSTRGFALSCLGDIEARTSSSGTIEWHCDTCEAAGTILNWQGSLWDMQKSTLH